MCMEPLPRHLGGVAYGLCYWSGPLLGGRIRLRGRGVWLDVFRLGVLGVGHVIGLSLKVCLPALAHFLDFAFFVVRGVFLTSTGSAIIFFAFVVAPRLWPTSATGVTSMASASFGGSEGASFALVCGWFTVL